MTSTRHCTHCGFELAYMVGRDGKELEKTVIVCEMCDLMPQMMHPMEEKERMAHQKKVSEWINRQRTQ